MCWINLSLKARLLLAFSTATVLLVLALGIISYTLMVWQLEESQQANLIELADNAAWTIDHAIGDKQLLLAQVARAREVTDYSRAHRYLPLARYLAGYREDFPEISFVNADGVEEVRSEEGQTSTDTVNLALNPGFLRARQSPGQVFIDRHPTADALVFTLGMKQYLGDVFFGCLRAVIPFEKLIGHIGKVGVGRTGSLGLVDDTGTLYEVTNNKVDRAHSLASSRLSAEAKGKIRDGIVVLDSSLGLKAFSAYSRVGTQPWHAVAVLPYTEFIQGPNKLAWSFAGAGILLLIVGCGVVFYLGDRLSTPLQRLVSATREVAMGNWEEITIHNAPGEVGDLVRAFNEMTSSLKMTTVSRDYLDNIFESMHESLLVVGLDGRIERTNRATCEMLGYEPAELLGRPVSLLLPENGVVAASWIDQLTRSSGPFSERIYRHKQGKSIPVTFSWARFSDPGGRTHGLVCLAQKQDSLHKPSDWRLRTRQEISR